MVFSHFFSKLPVKNSTGKWIVCIYKYDRQNWPYPSKKTTFVIPPHFDSNIQTQRNSDSDVSTGANDVESYGLDQSTNHNDNKNDKDYYYSQSYETPWGENWRPYFFVDTISTTTTPRSPTLSPPGKEYLCFQIEGKIAHTAQCAKSIAPIKVLKAIFDFDSFGKLCVINKGLLQSEQLKDICLPLGLTNH